MRDEQGTAARARFADLRAGESKGSSAMNGIKTRAGHVPGKRARGAWGRGAIAGATFFIGSALVVGGFAGAAFAATPSTTPTSSPSSSCVKSDVVIVSRNANLTTVSVRLASTSSGVSCDVSLHAYETEGPTWPTSGTQRLVDFATVHLTDTPQTLSVTGSKCFGQNDLVIGTTRNDGVDGPAPHYPNQVFASTMIATWIGGSACVSPTATPTQTATPTPTTPATVSPTELTSPTPTASPSPSTSVLGVQFEQSPPTSVLPTATSQLPFTGAPLAFEGLAAAGLIGAGAVLYRIGRRRDAEGAGLRD